MNKRRKGCGMENAPKTKIDFLLGFERGGFENVFKLFENRIPIRGDQKGGINRAMRLKNGPGPKMKAEPVTNVVRGHPKEVITKFIESLKKSRYYRRGVPARGRERRRGAVWNGDGI